MATAAAATRAAPWHVRLQTRVLDVECAAATLLAACEEPDAAAALEVRACVSDARRQRAAQRTRAAPCTEGGA